MERNILTRRMVVRPVLVLACVCWAARVHGADLDFLVPGVSLQSVTFTEGSSVEYLIVSEAYGIRDSSRVGLSVLGTSDEHVLLEIRSSPESGSEDEAFAVRLLLCTNVTAITSARELDACIREILIRDGTGSFREPTEKELEDFDPASLFLNGDAQTQRRRLDSERVDTEAGTFLCDVEEVSRKIVRPVSLGGVDAEKREEVTSTLWLSDEIPFWGLVRSRVEERRTTTVLAGASRAQPQAKTTITESVLLSFQRSP